MLYDNNILPEDIELWYFIENSLKKVMHLYNFKEIRPSIIQSNSLYKKYIQFSNEFGKHSLEKLLFNIENDLSLRPEGTLSVLNTSITKNALKIPQRVYYSGPMFKKNIHGKNSNFNESILHYSENKSSLENTENSYTQYHQIGAEILGTDNIISDIEVIHLAKALLKSLGITEIFLEINSYGCPKCRPLYIDALKDYIIYNLDEICEDCKDTILKYPQSIYKCNSVQCKRISTMAPITLDYLCIDCLDNFKEIKKLLSNLGTEFSVNPSLPMDYNYYTRLVFNFLVKIDKVSNILVRGGRYDTLSNFITDLPLPAVGFSFNVDSSLQILKEKSLFSTKQKNFSTCVCTSSQNMELLVLQVTQELHSHEIHTIIIEDIVNQNDFNKIATNYNCNIMLIFREDLIREGKIMILVYNQHQDIYNQDIIYLSDIMENVLRHKKHINQ